MYPRAQTRSDIIWTHYQRALQQDPHSTKNGLGYAACQAYVDATPADRRRIKVAVGNDESTMRANGQMVYRWLNPDEAQILPADMEPHVVNALPEPCRSACLDDLAAMYGLLAVPDFSRDADPCSSVARVMKECAEAVDFASKRLAGEARDACVVREAREAIASLKGMIAAIEQDSRPALKVAK